MSAPPTVVFEPGPDGVAIATLNRPEKMNALTFAGFRELRDLFTAAADEPDVRAIVLTGAGSGFCSGADLREVVSELTTMSTADLLAFTRLAAETVLAMRRLRKPIVAAVNGAAIGAGAVLALAADIRLASERARFGFVFPKLGLSGAAMGACWLLPRIVGLGRATELLMTGEVIDVYEADRIGLVNRVLPTEQLPDVAREMAASLAQGPTFAHAITKEMLSRSAGMDLAGALEAEAQAQQTCMLTHDFREGYRAIVRDRPPRFQGR